MPSGATQDDMLARASAHLRTVVRQYVLELDPALSTKTDRKQVELLRHTQAFAAVPLGYAQAVAVTHAPALLSRALSWCDVIAAPRLGIHALLQVGLQMVREHSVDDPAMLSQLIDRALRLPVTDGLLATKARALCTLAVSLVDDHACEATMLAKRAALLASRCTHAELAEMLAVLATIDTVTSCTDAILAHCSRTLVTTLSYMLSLQAQRQLLDILAQQHNVFMFPDSASNQSLTLKALVQNALRWHTEHFAEQWIAERQQVLEALAKAIDDPEITSPQQLTPLLGNTRDSTRVLSSEHRASGVTSGLPLLDGIDRETLRPSLRPPFPGESDAGWRARCHLGIEELKGWMRERHQELRQAMADVASISTPPAMTPALTTAEILEVSTSELEEVDAQISVTADPNIARAYLEQLTSTKPGLVNYAWAKWHGILLATRGTVPRSRATASHASLAQPTHAIAEQLIDILLAEQTEGTATVSTTRAQPAHPLTRAFVQHLGRGQKPHQTVGLFAALPKECVQELVTLLQHDVERGAIWLRQLVTAYDHDLATYGGTLSTFAEWLLVAARTSDYDDTDQETLTQEELLVVGRQRPSETLPDLSVLANHEPYLQRGRTLIYRDANADELFAYKLQRWGEPVAQLQHELCQLMHKRQQAHASVLPTPVAVAALPTEALGPSRQRLMTAGIVLADHPSCLIYRVDAKSQGLWTYAVDAKGAPRHAGIIAATQDVFAWLRRGELHTALTTKNHSVASTGARYYEWMVDAVLPPHQRRGMGRLDAVDAACEFANVRQTGVADLAEMANVGSLLNRAEKLLDVDTGAADPLPHVLWHPLPVARRLITAHAIGDYLLDLTLLTALASVTDSHSTSAEAPIEELKEIWSTAVTSFRTHDRLWPLLEATIDFRVMTAQLLYFLDARRYVDDFEKTLDRSTHGRPTRNARQAEALAQKLSRDLYHPGLSIHIDLTHHSQTWRRQRTDQGGLGFSVDGKHHDLGVFNGPWPLLELERALYLTAGLMLLL